MFVKDNLGVGSNNGLSADVPCAIAGSVEFQANNFPVKGLSGPCRKDAWSSKHSLEGVPSSDRYDKDLGVFL